MKLVSQIRRQRRFGGDASGRGMSRRQVLPFNFIADNPLEKRRLRRFCVTTLGTGSGDATNGTEGRVDEGVEGKLAAFQSRGDDSQRMMDLADAIASIMSTVVESGVEEAIMENGSVILFDKPTITIGTRTRCVAREQRSP